MEDHPVNGIESTAIRDVESCTVRRAISQGEELATCTYNNWDMNSGGIWYIYYICIYIHTCDSMSILCWKMIDDIIIQRYWRYVCSMYIHTYMVSEDWSLKWLKILTLQQWITNFLNNFSRQRSQDIHVNFLKKEFFGFCNSRSKQMKVTQPTEWKVWYCWKKHKRILGASWRITNK